MAAGMRPQTKKSRPGLWDRSDCQAAPACFSSPRRLSPEATRGAAVMPDMPYAEPVRACLLAWACTAVMATVLTMSGTVQPRERSFTGLFNP